LGVPLICDGFTSWLIVALFLLVAERLREGSSRHLHRLLFQRARGARGLAAGTALGTYTVLIRTL